MTDYVLDASVAAKWVLPSQDEPLAVESLSMLHRFAAGEMNFSVPDLFWTEMGDILYRSVLKGRISEQTASEAIEWLHELKLPTSSTRLLLDDAVRMAVSFERSLSDCVYLAFAVESGRPLVTADEEFVKAVGARLPIRWLGAIV